MNHFDSRVQDIVRRAKENQVKKPNDVIRKILDEIDELVDTEQYDGDTLEFTNIMCIPQNAFLTELVRELNEIHGVTASLAVDDSVRVKLAGFDHNSASRLVIDMNFCVMCE